MCFWESRRTTNDGMLTTCFLTLMSLPDQDSSVVDRFSKPELEDLGLQSTLQEIFNLETEHEIELHLGFIQDSNPYEPPEKSISLKEPFLVFLFKSKQLSGSRPDLGQAVLDPPDLPLVPQAVLTNELQLLVQAGLLEGPPGGAVHLGVHHWYSSVNHLIWFLRDPGVSLVEVNQAILSLVVIDAFSKGL